MNVGAACSTDRQEFKSWTIPTFMIKHLRKCAYSVLVQVKCRYLQCMMHTLIYLQGYLAKHGIVDLNRVQMVLQGA